MVFSCVLTKRLSAFYASLLSFKKANGNSYFVPSERSPGDRSPRQRFPGVSVTRVAGPWPSAAPSPRAAALTLPAVPTLAHCFLNPKNEHIQNCKSKQTDRTT